MINSTTDYSQFEFNELNRGVNDAHVRRLTKNIKENGLIQPIIVTADGNIIDGCRAMPPKATSTTSDSLSSMPSAWR